MQPQTHRNPYRATASVPAVVDPPKFRYGVVPAALCGFVAFLAAAYAALVIPNMLRDARNGYDAVYLTYFSLGPLLLFGVAGTCLLAAAQWLGGRWKLALAAHAVTGVCCVLLFVLFSG
jgi:hypothetical protein